MSAVAAAIGAQAASAFNAANAAYRAGRYAEVRDKAAQILQSAPDLVIAHILKARALRQFVDLAMARDAYDAALALSPSSFDALLERGNVLRGLGELSGRPRTILHGRTEISVFPQKLYKTLQAMARKAAAFQRKINGVSVVHAELQAMR